MGLTSEQEKKQISKAINTFAELTIITLEHNFEVSLVVNIYHETNAWRYNMICVDVLCLCADIVIFSSSLYIYGK